MRKQRKSRKPKETLQEVARRIREGENDSEIAKALRIHRTTVSRYRARSEGETVVRMARAEVVRDALAKHFADLCQLVEKLRKEVSAPSPEELLMDNLEAKGRFSVTHLDTGTVVHWQTHENGSVELCVPSEAELLFDSLRQHTRNSEIWGLFERWKEQGGKYLLGLSRFRGQVKKESMERTRLDIDVLADKPRLTQHFCDLIYRDACGYAFPDYRGWKDMPYEIRTIKPDWFELWEGGTRLAASMKYDDMELCRSVHQELIKRYRSPEEAAPALSSAASAWNELRRLETDIAIKLEKLRLKRTFPGQCDLCPG